MAMTVILKLMAMMLSNSLRSAALQQGGGLHVCMVAVNSSSARQTMSAIHGIHSHLSTHAECICKACLLAACVLPCYGITPVLSGQDV